MWCGNGSSDLGFAAEFADAYIAMLAQTLDKPALVTHDVEKILGRPALTFAIGCPSTATCSRTREDDRDR